MKYSASIFMTLCLLLLGCGMRKSKEDSTCRISIPASYDQPIESGDFIQCIDSLILHTDKGIWISEVKDLCMNDSLVFILDMNHRIFAFDAQSGALKHSIQNTGHSGTEYIAPMAITLCDSVLYVLDLQGMSILFFDADLSFLSRIRIPCPTLDFTKVDDGFLLYNLSVTDELKQIVHIDESGQPVGSFFTPESHLDLLPSEHIFTEDPAGETYFMLPLSDSIYRWKDGHPEAEYIIDFGGSRPREKSSSSPIQKGIPSALSTFLTSDYVITSFLSHSLVNHSILHRKSGRSQAGVVNTNGAYAFFPKWQSESALIGITESVDTATNQSKTVLLMYRLYQPATGTD